MATKYVLVIFGGHSFWVRKKLSNNPQKIPDNPANILFICVFCFCRSLHSMPNMTGRPGYRTMEMNGGSSALYLGCAPCVPLIVHCLMRVEAEGLLDYQGRAGIISIVRWNLRPVIFGIDTLRTSTLMVGWRLCHGVSWHSG